jgi:hypothetical protein
MTLYVSGSRLSYQSQPIQPRSATTSPPTVTSARRTILGMGREGSGEGQK